MSAVRSSSWATRCHAAGPGCRRWPSACWPWASCSGTVYRPRPALSRRPSLRPFCGWSLPWSRQALTSLPTCADDDSLEVGDVLESRSSGAASSANAGNILHVRSQPFLLWPVAITVAAPESYPAAGNRHRHDAEPGQHQEGLDQRPSASCRALRNWPSYPGVYSTATRWP